MTNSGTCSPACHDRTSTAGPVQDTHHHPLSPPYGGGRQCPVYCLRRSGSQKGYQTSCHAEKAWQREVQDRKTFAHPSQNSLDVHSLLEQRGSDGVCCTYLLVKTSPETFVRHGSLWTPLRLGLQLVRLPCTLAWQFEASTGLEKRGQNVYQMRKRL